MISNKYMKKAYELAQKAFMEDEVPIGAVIVDTQTGEIITQSYNQTAHVLDATAHAEMLAIQQACKKLKTNRLWGTDMYVTLEPCTMCAAAISFARIENLYIGALDIKGGGVKNGVKFYQSTACHHKPKVHLELINDECGQILQDFFKAKRKQIDKIS